MPQDSIQGPSSERIEERLVAAGELKIAEAEVAQQAESVETLKDIFEEAVNPGAVRFARRQEDLATKKTRFKEAELHRLERRVVPPEDIDAFADQFSKQNPELKKQVLVLLLDKVKEAKTKEALLEILYQFYPDPTLAEDALNFLLKTTVGDLQKIVEEAKATHEEQYGREIRAGQNIAEEVKKYAAAGIGAPTKLRDMYRDLTGNLRDPVPLIIELSDRYPYKELRKVTAFLLHSLGADFKSPNSSINIADNKGLITSLFSLLRSLQAMQGSYLFFRNRNKLVDFLFKREGIEPPKTLNFETMTKQYIALLLDRYPSAEKVLQIPGKLGVDQSLTAKIIILSQFRDATGETSLKLFRQENPHEHRKTLFNAIIEALDSLEDELDLLETQAEEERQIQETGEEDIRKK